MFTRRTCPPLIVCTLAALAGAAEPVLRVYDVRDLVAVLPSQPVVVQGVPILKDVPIIGQFYRPEGAAQPAGAPATASPTEVVVSRLCGQLQLQQEELLSGVYVVTGELPQHEQLVKLLDNVRTLYEGAYEFDLFAYPVAAPQAPAVGAGADTQSAMLHARQMLPRRVESRIVITEEVSYVRDWVPIVGTSSVGYDPDIGTVTKGLRLVLTAGGTQSADAHGAPINLRIRGEFADAQIAKQSSPLAPVSGGTLELGLPTVTSRSIECDIQLKPGQPTVLAVIPGAKAGESIVLAGALRELRGPGQ